MDATSLLVDRLQALRERLNLADAAAGAAPAFAEAIAKSRDRLDDAIPDARASEAAWHELAVWEKTDASLFREVLAYLQAIGQPALPASGAGLLARGLVAELCTKLPLGDPPVIAPDVADSFSDFVEIIRLRYPPAGIWDVPVVAHELGHFAAYRLTSWEDGLQRSQAVRGFISEQLDAKSIQSESEREKWRFWLNELFADAFATYCVGPCYAASALLLRFDVAQACDGDQRTHPSSAARAVAILEILREMNREAQDSYTTAINVLERQWMDLLGFAEKGNCRGEWVPEMAYQLHQIVRKVARRVQYENWRYADESLQYVLTDPTKAPEQRFTARDLLNAAWLARAGGGDPASISARALQLWAGVSVLRASV
jgi:hypothetical protein